MFVEPGGLDRDELRRVLRGRWGMRVTTLEYVPVGFGTHHYRAVDADGATWFVNVDQLSTKTDPPNRVIDGLERSLGTAAALRDAGLTFVHAPKASADGPTVATMDDFAVSVYGYLEGESYPYGEYPSEELRGRVLAALGQMHASTAAVPAQLPRTDGLDIVDRPPFERASRDRHREWSSGPYGERARALLHDSIGHIDEMLARYDALVPAVLSTSDGWVVTHGEPHAANVMTTVDGRLAIIDWDTVALAPRERDLWILEPRTAADWAAYGVSDRVDPAAMELYRLRWRLGDICAYMAALHAPHADDENIRVAWRSLQGYLTVNT